MNAKNIFGAICVAIALFFLWPAVFGSWAQVQALKAALAERQDLVAKRTQILKDAATQYAKYQDILKGSQATVFASFVPTKRDAAELVSATSSIASSTGMQLTEIKVTEAQTSKNKDPYTTVGLSLSLSGSYSDLKTFLQNLETYVRILNVKKISIGGGGQGAALKFAIDAETYYIK